jgi:hypothetical protein
MPYEYKQKDGETITKYTNVETAKFIRKHLKETYPTIKFSVKCASYSGGATLKIRWTDGPSLEQMEAVQERFRSGSRVHDPYSDYGGYTTSYTHTIKGELVQYETCTVSGVPDLQRDYTQEFIEQFADTYAQDNGLRYTGSRFSEWSGFTPEFESLTGRNAYETNQLTHKFIDNLGKISALTPNVKKSLDLSTPANSDGPTIGEYKNKPILTLPTDGKPFSFGKSKAQAILNNQELIETFVNGGASTHISKYKGFDVLTLPDSSNFKFGKSKAKTILQYWDSIVAFINGETLPATAAPSTEEQPTESAPPATDSKLADKLRILADKMESAIEAKLNPAIGEQRRTARRERIADSMYQDGLTLKKTQAALRMLADRHEQNDWTLFLRNNGHDYPNLVGLLQALTSRAAVHDVITSQKYPSERLEKMGISQTALGHVRDAINKMIEGNIPAPETNKERELKVALRKAYDTKIDGFFPTPSFFAEFMVGEAKIKSHHTILEPSAGVGHIADAIQATHPTNELDICEFSPMLANILQMKGYDVTERDFYNLSKPYDRIIMNPPFEQHQDIDHVRRAYDLLNPNGRLVAIVSAGSIDHNGMSRRKKVRDWMEWLDNRNAEINRITSDDGKSLFLQSEKPTSVFTYLIIIDKPDTETSTAMNQTTPDETPSNGEKTWTLVFTSTSKTTEGWTAHQRYTHYETITGTQKRAIEWGKSIAKERGWTYNAIGPANPQLCRTEWETQERQRLLENPTTPNRPRFAIGDKVQFDGFWKYYNDNETANVIDVRLVGDRFEYYLEYTFRQKAVRKLHPAQDLKHFQPAEADTDGYGSEDYPKRYKIEAMYIEWSESSIAKTADTQTLFTDVDEFNNHLRAIAHSHDSNGGYYKTQVVVCFEDGNNYGWRMDLNTKYYANPDIKKEFRDIWERKAGLHLEHGKTYRETYPYINHAKRLEALANLAKYDLGQVEPEPVAEDTAPQPPNESADKPEIRLVGFDTQTRAGRLEAVAVIEAENHKGELVTKQLRLGQSLYDVTKNPAHTGYHLDRVEEGFGDIEFSNGVVIAISKDTTPPVDTDEPPPAKRPGVIQLSLI